MAPGVASTVEPTVYIHALAAWLRQHESSLADFVKRAPQQTAPSWTTILTLGVVGSDVPVPRKPPLVLRFDPHHLYFLLLKFDEAGIPGLGALDVVIDGGPSRPMSVNYGASNLPIPLPFQGGDNSDAISLRSTFSGVSSFSIGSGWWGSSAKPPPDETADVKYLYSCCTKLPAVRLGPFTFSTTPSPNRPISELSRPVKDFEDCPPPDTAVPLYAFKNLQSLALDDLDPRAFLGWDALSVQLRSLEVTNSGMEDVGELICDSVVEDAERRRKGQGGVGEERRRRQELSQSSSQGEGSATPPATPTSNPPPSPSASYPTPPAASWSRLSHLNLSRNSLTFVPVQPMTHLSSLTSLDLSSNLLISVPPALSSLYSLRSLNLRDNMIDSLHGLAKALGAITVLNLSQNRLENISGLDRLLALERIDLRENRLRECLEVSRLSRLPNLVEVYVEGNPFTKRVEEGGEDGWKLKCFSYFCLEGKDPEAVKVDGTTPSLTEKRALAQMEHGSGRRRSASESDRALEARVAASEAKIVGRRVVTTPLNSRFVRGGGGGPKNGFDTPIAIEVGPSAPSSSSPSHAPIPHSPLGSPTKKAGFKPRRRKPNRIVDLDGGRGPTSTVASSVGGDLSGTEANSGALSDSEEASSSAKEGQKVVSKKQQGLESRLPSDVPEEIGTAPRRHMRYPTSPIESSSTAGRVIVDGSSSLGATPTRRQRVTASTFEPPSSTSTAQDDPFLAPPESSADAFRKKIEALRSEVGDSWLSVLGERELTNERNKSQSDESGADSAAKKAAVASQVQPSTLGGEVGGVPVVKVVKKKKGKKKAV
ncbi:hypothetical protein T439DRAFT_382242 [Meredithblackwellia eburnea MCA 4105]